jgi:hypothetical protein
LHSLNNRIFVDMSFKNPYYSNVSKLINKFISIWMNENNKSFFPRDMFQFIHHPKYGCRDHLGLNSVCLMHFKCC